MNERKTRCLIVDDEPIAIKVIESHLQKVSDVEVVATCNSALAAFELIRKQPVDLVFLDIQMPELSGIDLINALENPPPVIFTTAHRDYALDGFELDVVDFLLKPISLPRLLRALDKYRRQHLGAAQPPPSHSEPRLLTVRSNRQTVTIPLETILFIESLSDYTKIHTSDRVVVCKEKISNLSRQLEPMGFLRIHRSFLVAISKITSYSADAVHLGDRVLPMSRSYKQAVRERLSESRL